MEAKKFAWIYLIEHGDAGFEQSYYGGLSLKDQRVAHLHKSDWKWDSASKIKEFYLNEIKRIGVDWAKTREPQNNEISLFTDTFHDSERKEIIEGELILNNGLKQSWFADKLEIANVFEMMAAVSEFQTKYISLFGEDE